MLLHHNVRTRETSFEIVEQQKILRKLKYDTYFETNLDSSREAVTGAVIKYSFMLSPGRYMKSEEKNSHSLRLLRLAPVCFVKLSRFCISCPPL